jgi:4-aminobutyrate aminotransferase-like enzyme
VFPALAYESNFKFFHVVGNHLLKGLEELRRDFDIVGDVRGKGLMVAESVFFSLSLSYPD